MKNKNRQIIGLKTTLILLIACAVFFLFGSCSQSKDLFNKNNGYFKLLPMTIEPRQGHTATLLQDGRVLITGGGFDTKISNTAEIYDPTTNKFTKTGDMTTPRYSHSAVLLQDGKVLITGGRMHKNPNRPSIVLKSAEIYDPKTGKFTKINNMNHAWNSHNMILLPDGKVLLCSNINTFKELPPCLTTYCPNNAVLLNDGTVLLASDEFPDNRPQIFNPKTEKFKYTGKMTHYRSFSTATLLKDGEVIIIGGGTRGGFAPAEIYNPKTGLFRLAAKINQTRYGHSSILLPAGKVLVVGGDTGLDESLRGIKSAELYDPQEDRFIKIEDMHFIREYRPTLTLLKNGNVLIMGEGKRPELYISK